MNSPGRVRLRGEGPTCLNTRNLHYAMSLILDSVTVFPPDARGRAAIAASHGGTYAAYLAAKAGINAVILCDAGVGRERAGIGGLDYLDGFGVAAAAIGHRSARIGHGGGFFARGLLTFANVLATMSGVTIGMK